MKKSIILIHGLFMHSIVMKFMERQFKRLGYTVHQFSYRTVKYSDDTLHQLDELIKKINTEKLYLVGHSMGGLVSRQYIEKFGTNSHKDISVVTVGTPHYSSRLGKHLEKGILKIIFGTSGDSGITKELPQWSEKVPMGCIAGEYPVGINHIFTKLVHKAPSDGTVFLDEAILDNCTDSIIVKSSHTGLVYSKNVVMQCHYFFDNFKFNKQ